MHVKIYTFVVLTLLCAASTSPGNVDFETESSAKEYVDSNPPESKNECVERVRQSMRKGFWNLSAALIEHCRDRRMDVSSAVYKEASDVSSRLKDLKSRLRKKSKVSIAPAFQWAQTKETVYLSVKLAHKLDTPATLGCVVTTSNFDTTGVKFRADCEKQRKSFFLTIETLGELNPENCSWEYNSVGRVTFTMHKQETKLWPRLLKSKSKPGNMHVWWDMKQKLEKEQEDERKRKEKERKEAEEEEKKKKKKNNNKEGEERNRTNSTGSDGGSTKEDL